MPTAVHYLPIATTALALFFAAALFRRWHARRPAPHLLWWAVGMLTYAAGTVCESLTTLLGWQEPVFRAWYITGALLGGWPLAQGSAYLHLRRETATRWMLAVLAVVVVAGTCVLLTPIDMARVEPHRLSGKVMAWSWVRAFSPFVNLYAMIFLIGGAIRSAAWFRRDPSQRGRFVGNVCIALGGLLPGIGGSFTRLGHVEVLYVTELLGLALIYVGYRYATGAQAAPVRAVAAAA